MPIPCLLKIKLSLLALFLFMVKGSSKSTILGPSMIEPFLKNKTSTLFKSPSFLFSAEKNNLAFIVVELNL